MNTKKNSKLSGSVEEEGKFFRNYISEVQGSITRKQFDEFSNLKTDTERIRFVYGIPKVHEITLPVTDDFKDSNRAMDYKTIGNKMFAQAKYGLAAKNYWLGIQDCPENDGELLATLHANRSACLYNMEQYHEALQDIRMAFNLPYPKNLYYKIYERMARCRMAIHDLKSAVESFQNALTSLDNAANLNLSARQKKEADFTIMIELLRKSLSKGAEKTKKESKTLHPPVPDLTNGHNKHYPSASYSVGFSMSEAEGRFAVAAEDIEPDDVLLVEKPHCAALLYEYCGTHCQNCFCRVMNPFSCLWCKTVIFCSQRCLKIGMDSFHKIECKYLKCLLNQGASIICCLAIRLIAAKGLQYFLKIRPNLDKELDDNVTYDPTDYRTIYNLCTHKTNRNPDDYFQRTTMSVILLRFLQTVNFFENPASSTLSDTEEYIGSLILHNLQLLQFNAHEISELQFQADHPGDLSRAKSTFIGGGLFPTLALFNHSCEPGIVRYFSGSKIIVKAIKPIKRGDMIPENYGPIYTETSCETRKMELKTRYWFDCNCIPCSEKWPLFDEMKMDTLPFRCNVTELCRGFIKVDINTEEFMFKCPKCTKMICIFPGLRSLNDTEGMFKQGEQLLASKKYKDALQVFLKIYKILNNVLKPPYKDLCLCQQKIRSCMLTLGNAFQIPGRP